MPLSHSDPGPGGSTPEGPTPSSPGLPLAVWPCAQTPPALQRAQRGLEEPVAPTAPAMVPELARRLIDEYSRPGELVADVMCGSGTIVVEAALAGRRVLAMDIEPACVAQTLTHLDTLLAREQQGHYEELWQGDARHAHALLPGHQAGVDLVVFGLPRAAVGPPSARRLAADNLARATGAALQTGLAEVMTACAALLRPGGRMAVVAPHHHAHGGLAHLPPRMVEAAQQAGLDYLQHVIALTRPIRGDRLQEGPEEAQQSRLNTASAAATARHTPAHDNVLLFTKPATAPVRTHPQEVAAPR